MHQVLFILSHLILAATIKVVGVLICFYLAHSDFFLPDTGATESSLTYSDEMKRLKEVK